MTFTRLGYFEVSVFKFASRGILLTFKAFEILRIPIYFEGSFFRTVRFSREGTRLGK